MIISNDSKLKENIEIFQEIELKHSTKVKILGTIFDETLKWNTTIKYDKNSLINQLKTRSAAIRNIRNKVSLAFAKQLANSIYFSKLYYHIELIGNTTQTNIKPINSVTAKLARFLNGYRGIGKTNEWNMNQLNWMNYENLHEYSLVKYTHKLIHSNQDHMFKDRLIHNRRGRNLDQDKLGPYDPNIGMNKLGETYLYKAVGYYNKLPKEITMIEETHRFKKVLKKHFLKEKYEVMTKPRNQEITQPFIIEMDEICDENAVQSSSSIESSSIFQFLSAQPRYY